MLGGVGTYVWNTAVCAPADLWPVDVDEDSGVAERASAAVAGRGAALDPADWLLVNELDGGVWARLFHAIVSSCP